MKHLRMSCLVALIALPVWAGGDSSDGHSHGTPAPVPVTVNAPRAAAATEYFEVVVGLEDKHLVVYVDRFASNEPVAEAKVEVEGAGLKGLAVETRVGTYMIDLTAPLPPGRHPLTISIEAGDTADLLSVMLDAALPVVAEDPARDRGKRTFWGVVGLVIMVSGIRLVARHNREKSHGSLA